MVKNPPANAGGPRDAGSIPGSGRSPGEGHGNPFQYSCLENPMGRGIWQATVYRVGKESETTEQLSTAHTHTHTLKYIYACSFVCLGCVDMCMKSWVLRASPDARNTVRAYSIRVRNGKVTWQLAGLVLECR